MPGLRRTRTDRESRGSEARRGVEEERCHSRREDDPTARCWGHLSTAVVVVPALAYAVGAHEQKDGTAERPAGRGPLVSTRQRTDRDLRLPA